MSSAAELAVWLIAGCSMVVLAGAMILIGGEVHGAIRDKIRDSRASASGRDVPSFSLLNHLLESQSAMRLLDSIEPSSEESHIGLAHPRQSRRKQKAEAGTVRRQVCPVRLLHGAAQSQPRNGGNRHRLLSSRRNRFRSGQSAWQTKRQKPQQKRMQGTSRRR